MTTCTEARTDKPDVLPVKGENIPGDLTTVDRWLGWRWHWNGKKFDKPPLSVKTGYKCAKNNLEAWVSFDQALSAHQAGRFDGIGFEFEDVDDLAGIDLDDCRNRETGELTEKAKALVAWANSYTEISPSGNGVKIFIRGKLPWGNKANHGVGVEVYETGSYFCVTGQHLEGTPKTTRDCTPILLDLLVFAFGVDEDGQPFKEHPHVDDRELAVDALGGLNTSRAIGYGDWLRVGMALHATDTTLLDEWDRWSQSCGEKYQPGTCAKKWQSFGKGGNGVGLGTLIYWARQDGWIEPWKRNDHARPKASARGNLPEIDAGCEDLPLVTRQAWNAIRAANDPKRLFRYGGRVVRTETGDEDELVLRDINVDRMCFELADSACWYRWKRAGKELVKKEAAPPDKVVRNTLATPNIDLPQLVRVVEAPVFASNGTLQTEPGYHKASRTYYAPAAGFTVGNVPEEPTQDDISFAVDLLAHELLGEFPFIGDAEKAHAAAVLLLPFAHDLIDSCTPFHLIEKPCPGTGATLMVDMLAYPAIGRPISVMTEGRDEDEWRKRLTAKLRGGAAFIVIDNLKRRLDSAALSSAITSTMWEDRILGKSEMVKTPVRCVWVGTGNNPALSSEMARRTVRIRLDSKIDQPWLRKGFRHPDLRIWVKQNRGQLVWAALTLIRAWIVTGRPKGDIRLGMFESWSETMGGILKVAGIDGFLANLNEFYKQSDAEGSAVRTFVAAWWDAHNEREVGVKELWRLVDKGDADLNLGDGSERSQRTRMGKILANLRDRMFRIETEEGTNTDGGRGMKSLRVARGGTCHRAQMWKLEETGKDA